MCQDLCPVLGIWRWQRPDPCLQGSQSNRWKHFVHAVLHAWSGIAVLHAGLEKRPSPFMRLCWPYRTLLYVEGREHGVSVHTAFESLASEVAWTTFLTFCWQRQVTRPPQNARVFEICGFTGCPGRRNRVLVDSWPAQLHTSLYWLQIVLSSVAYILLNSLCLEHFHPKCLQDFLSHLI